MKILAISMTVLLAGANTMAALSEVTVDSAHSIALVGTIKDQTMVTLSNSEARIETQIRGQLMYTIGQLNGFSAVADLNRVDLEIGESEVQENGKFLTTYSAKLFVAWPRNLPIPGNFKLILPQGNDRTTLEEFYNAYGDSDCLHYSAHDVSRWNFWYFYRP